MSGARAEAILPAVSAILRWSRGGYAVAGRKRSPSSLKLPRDPPGSIQNSPASGKEKMHHPPVSARRTQWAPTDPIAASHFGGALRCAAARVAYSSERGKGAKDSDSTIL